MGRTRQKEKQSARTVRPKTLRAIGYKKRRREIRVDFSRKKKYNRFAASRRWKNGDVRPEELRALFISRPRATEGKTFPNLHAKKTVFCANSDSECSACLGGLLTYIVPPYTPSPLTSRYQLAPSAPRSLAAELIHVTAAPPIAAYECRRRRSCSYINPTTEQTPAIATSRTTRYVHPSLKLSGEPSLPPEEYFAPFFFDSP
jgi:hypothetical protein